MYITVLLLAGLLSAADMPARRDVRDFVVESGPGYHVIVPAQADRDYLVGIGSGLRVVVPALGNCPVPDAADRRQIFEFYIGLSR
jgi:hypothetical protein